MVALPQLSLFGEEQSGLQIHTSVHILQATLLKLSRYEDYNGDLFSLCVSMPFWSTDNRQREAKGSDHGKIVIYSLITCLVAF